MFKLPVKRLSARVWLQIFGIWTLAAISMATQFYLNTHQANPEASWGIIFLKQLPAWYLCALLTPVLIYIYERYPLDRPDWKKNLLKQTGIALLVLLIFSHFRLLAMSLILNSSIGEMSLGHYLHAFPAQMAWDLAVYAFIMAVIFADKAYSGKKQKEVEAIHIHLRNQELEHQLRLAQLEALRLQLSPHFLFNTLNTISALIRSGDAATAIKVNARLGDLLRTTLYAPNEQFVSLEKEMELTDLYLSIETLRFRDRLEVIKKIGTECLSMPVPYLILQPLLENAIKHGIARHSAARIIRIEATSDTENMDICIFNEGAKLPEGWMVESNWRIGLKNVNSRLRKMYGNQFSFRIENHPEHKGVQVSLSIPTKTEPSYALI